MLTHLDDRDNPRMMDVGDKQITHRTATAQSIVVLPAEVLAHIHNGELQTKKGSIFQIAIIAGIMAAKKTGELIPLCHPLGLDNCEVVISWNDENEIVINCTASITAKTGVEMEALTGACIAALTIYDMCKAMSQDIVIRETKLVSKTGGKRDFFRK